MKAYIYKIINEKTDDIYIGSTNNLKNRFKSHKSNARLNKNGKLYDCMREYGVENFHIEIIEELDVETNFDIGEKEIYYFEKLKSSLNMKKPNIIQKREFGRIYKLYLNDEYFYIGSTMKEIKDRLSDHKSASIKGKTPLYKFMREHGKDNFSITCLEDDIPVNNLIVREEFWIKDLQPTLNKNTDLTITEQERDRIKYLKNKEKVIERVKNRKKIKYDEIILQKREHYKKQQEILKNCEIIPYTTNPFYTQEQLEKENLLNLKIIAKQFSIHFFIKLKKDYIETILKEQNKLFPS
jgi:predicted GIY-YIG superfamily endonuclease